MIKVIREFSMAQLTMKLTTVYSKTAKGAQTLTQRGKRLPNELVRALNLVDGRATVDELLGKAGESLPSALPQIFADLARDGYLKVVSTAPLTEFSLSPGLSDSMVVSETIDETFFKILAETKVRKSLMKEANENPQEAREKAEKEATLMAKNEAAQQQIQAKASAEAVEQSRKDEVQRKIAGALALEEAALKARREADIRAHQDKVAKLETELAQVEEQARQDAVEKEITTRLKQEEGQRNAAEANALEKLAQQARDIADNLARRRNTEKELAELEQQIVKEAEAEEKAQAEIRKLLRLEARAKEEAILKKKTEEAERIEREKLAEQERQAAEALAIAEAEQKAKADEDARIQAEAEEKARIAAERENQARLEAEEKARAEKERLKAEAEARAQAEAERLEQERVAELEKQAAEAQAFAEAVQKEKAEEEARLMAEAEAIAREEAERKEQERAARAAEVRAIVEAEERAQAEEEARLKAEADAIAREEAELKRRKEIEERAIAEAVEQAKREAHEKERRDEEARAAVEAEARAKIEAERKAREEATALIIAEAVEQARLKAEEHARLQKEAQDNARAMAEQNLRKEAEQDELDRSAIETRIRSLVEERAAAAAEKAREQTANKPKKFKRPVKWVKATLISLAMLIVLPVILLQISSLNFFIPPIEKLASNRIGEPVSIKSMHASWWPVPHLRLEEISIGDLRDIKIPVVKIMPALTSLFSETKSINVVEIDSLHIDQSALLRAIAWVGPGDKLANIQLHQIELRAAVLDVTGMPLPAFEADITLATGKFSQASIRSTDKKIEVTIAPENDGFVVNVNAHEWQPPIWPNLTFTELHAKAMATSSGMLIKEIEGRLYNGKAKGNASLKWGNIWGAEGNLNIENVSLANALPALTNDIILSGRLDAKAVYSMQSRNLGTLFDTPRIKASFNIQDGSLGNIDLARALQPQAVETTGGKTLFTNFSGSMALDGKRYQYRQLKLAAGLLNANGEADILPDQKLSGKTNVEMKLPSSTLRTRLNLSGELKQPVLRR